MCLAIPGKVVEMDPENPQIGVVDVLGVRRKVDFGLLEEHSVLPDDWVLIHVGFAMSKISEVEAIDQLRILAILGESAAALEEVQGYGLDEEPNFEGTRGPLQ